MANLSPTSESFFESLCSLRFASQVNQCELGKPKRQLEKESQAINSNSNEPTGPALQSKSSSSLNSAANKKRSLTSR